MKSASKQGRSKAEDYEGFSSLRDDIGLTRPSGRDPCFLRRQFQFAGHERVKRFKRKLGREYSAIGKAKKS